MENMGVLFNLRLFILENNMSDINLLVEQSFGFQETTIYESMTPMELELNSMSNQNGEMIVVNENNETRLIFKVDPQYSHSDYLELTFDHPLSQLSENEEIVGVMEGPKSTSFDELRSMPGVSIGSFHGGGSLTYEHGIDFTFSSSLFSGQYNLLESSGMIGARLKLIRVG